MKGKRKNKNLSWTETKKERRPCRHTWKAHTHVHPFLTSSFDAGSTKVHASAAFITAKQPLGFRWIGGSPLTGFDPRTVQTVASRFLGTYLHFLLVSTYTFGPSENYHIFTQFTLDNWMLLDSAYSPKHSDNNWDTFQKTACYTSLLHQQSTLIKFNIHIYVLISPTCLGAPAPSSGGIWPTLSLKFYHRLVSKKQLARYPL